MVRGPRSGFGREVRKPGRSASPPGPRPRVVSLVRLLAALNRLDESGSVRRPAGFFGMNDSLSILAVEDDPDDQSLLADLLGRTKVRVETCFVHTSEEAIALLEDCARGSREWP